MQFQVEREVLLHALQVAQSVVRGTQCPDVRITATERQVVLRATDYEIGLRLPLAGADAAEPGVVVVPPDRLAKILRESDDSAVRCQSAKTHLKLALASAKYTVHGVDPEDFASFPEPAATGGVKIDAAVLREMIRRVVYAAAAERSRYTLDGVRWEGRIAGLRLVATDGRRLAMVDRDTEGGDPTVALPPAIATRKSMAVLEKILTTGGVATCKIADNRLVVAVGGVRFSALLMEGKYPEYESVIRAPGITTAITLAAVGQAIRQVAPLAEDESRAVQIAFRKDGTTIRAALKGAGGGRAEVDMPFAYAGPDMVIAFDCAYLRDAARSLGDTAATLDIAGPREAIIIKSEDGFTNLVMPVTVGGPDA